MFKTIAMGNFFIINQENLNKTIGHGDDAHTTVAFDPKKSIT